MPSENAVPTSRVLGTASHPKRHRLPGTLRTALSLESTPRGTLGQRAPAMEPQNAAFRVPGRSSHDGIWVDTRKRTSFAGFAGFAGWW